MNKIYNSNMEKLMRANIKLHDSMKNIIAKNTLVINAYNNQKTIIKKFKNNALLVHSKYNPNNQAKYMSDFYLDDNDEIVVLFGMGLAYELKEMIKKDNKKYYIVIEPDKEIFKSALENVDLKLLFNPNNNIYFTQTDNYEHMVGIFANIVTEKRKLNIKFIILPFYNELYGELIDRFFNEANIFINCLKIDINTNLIAQQSWVQNYMLNLKYLKDTFPIEVLKDRFNNVPAIVVSAGPSLNYNLEHLKKVYNKALIVGVGSAVKTVDNNDVKIHMAGAIDGSEKEGELFKNLKLNKDASILYTTQVYHTIVNEFSGHKFLMNVGPMDDMICKILKYPHSKSFSGASVANVVIQNLSEIGCNPIIFLGQDLCYVNGENYAKGSEQFVKATEEQMETNDYIKMLNKNNEVVYTNDVFISMKHSIEFTVNNHKNVTFLNGTSNGLKIKGSKDIDFNDYVDNILSNQNNLNIEEGLRNVYKSNVDENNIRDFLEKVKLQIEDVINICRSIMDIINSKSSEEYKLKCINKNEDKLKNIDIYKLVILALLNKIDYIFNFKDEIKGKYNLYLYVLDKCMLMKNSLNNTEIN